MAAQKNLLRWLRRFGLPVVAASITLAFQNCYHADDSKGQHSAKDNSPSLSMTGNGDGYDGKLSYVARDVERPCADGGANSEILLTFDMSSASKVRDNCTAVEAAVISEFEVMAHNQKDLIYENKLYEIVEKGSPSQGQLLCRGKSDGISLSENFVVDAKVSANFVTSPPRFSGRVILGIYDSAWKLKEVKDMGEVEVEPYTLPNGPEGHAYYQSASDDMDQDHFVLDVMMFTMQGELLYFRPVESEQGPLPSELRRVPNLRCYSPSGRSS